MGVLVKNNAYSTLASGITNSATTITLATGTGTRFPAAGGSDYFYATLVDTSNNQEIVKVTARSVDTLTVVRAQDGTLARAFATGDRIELRVVAALLSDIRDSITPADGTVTTAKIVDANVTSAKLATGAVTTLKIADANVTTDKIADAGVTTAKIADANVTAAKLASNAVTTAKITDANVTPAKLSGGQSGSAPAFAVRAWVVFGSSGSTPVIAASGNIASVVRNTTGEYTITFTTAMPNANYAIMGTAKHSTDGLAMAVTVQGTPSASSFKIQLTGVSLSAGSASSASADSPRVSLAVVG